MMNTVWIWCMDKRHEYASELVTAKGRGGCLTQLIMVCRLFPELASKGFLHWEHLHTVIGSEAPNSCVQNWFGCPIQALFQAFFPWQDRKPSVGSTFGEVSFTCKRCWRTLLRSESAETKAPKAEYALEQAIPFPAPQQTITCNGSWPYQAQRIPWWNGPSWDHSVEHNLL
jgi:hypothetical protein